MNKNSDPIIDALYAWVIAVIVMIAWLIYKNLTGA